jgi:hypothetical protein
MTTFKVNDRVYPVLTPYKDRPRVARMVLGTVVKIGQAKFSTDLLVFVRWDDRPSNEDPVWCYPHELIKEANASLTPEQALVRDLVKDVIACGLSGTPAFRHLHDAAEIIASHSGSGLATLWSTTLGRVED